MRRHVESAVARLDPVRYSQEPAYVAALLARLDGVVYEGSGGRIEIRSTIVADRGPNSAEWKWGADFAVVASLRHGVDRVEKGVLAQAKKGSLAELARADMRHFLEQCRKISQATESILGLEVPLHAGEGVLVREIRMKRPVDTNLFADQGWPPPGVGRPQSLADYFANGLLGCSHGDTRPEFVSSISDSRLSQLAILGESFV